MKHQPLTRRTSVLRNHDSESGALGLVHCRDTSALHGRVQHIVRHLTLRQLSGRTDSALQSHLLRPLPIGAPAADTPVTPHVEHGIAAPEPPPAFIPPGQAISPPAPAVEAPPMIPPPDVSHAAGSPQAPVSQAHVSQVVLPSAALPPVSIPDAPGSVPPVQRERTTLPVTHA